ncbi:MULTISPECIES: cysteine desulfurase family protein [Carnobacterium]|uniref:cysteine desulfurase family protein n=1 Tax=Carnobacterium TaxID=2747 RepID=UPI001071965A|nr:MULTISPECIES: cysteine desulfurase family protein [Carnobacterium]MDT1939106.1 cysteine desulfurase [Carnobacterium divergens]MDT1941544.1 cysteine desulfurase [Carnobacterium divergens]MDT1947342.1 cysteine desulfurase [Carnobacterium divergens]MDT1949781.1 cysteine desulfurase [Carnobacterium divergens]MDT1954959.1 cysteine desulfurase [Carnobacterium divergens]
MEKIYLDHAATSPVHPEVLEVTFHAMKEHYGNASSIHGFGREARKLLDEARSVFAKSIGAKPIEIVMTSGGTESDNTAIIETALSRAHFGKHLITTAVEHHAVLEPMEYLESMGFEVTYLPVDETGLVHLEDLIAAVRPDTSLVSVMYGNNEVGTIMNIQEIGAFLAETETYFHTDAVQAYGLEDIDVKQDAIDLLSVSAHKINGPKGIGFLYINEEIHLPSFMRGGEQETKRRAGTENIPAIVGFQRAVEIAEQERSKRRETYDGFRNQLIEGLKQAEIDFEINGNETHYLKHILNIWMKGVSSEQLLMNLDLLGIGISAGSACTAGNMEPSHVLSAMFGKESPRVKESVRVSFGLGTTTEMIDEAVKQLSVVVKRLKHS